MNTPLPQLTSRLATLAAAIAAAVASLGAVVLVGWWLDIAALKSVLPHWVTMKPNTAAGLLLAGMALWLRRGDAVAASRRRAGQACATIVALLGLLTLAEILSGRDFGIDTLLFAEAVTAAQTAAPGQMAPATAFNFLFAGLALLALDAETRGGLRPAQWLMLPPMGVAFVVLAGYFYSVEALYRVGPYTSMAAHTALAFFLLGFGLFWVRPTRGIMALATSDTSGGMLARRVLPWVLVAIPLLFWVRLLGERAGHYDTEFGIALMVVANMALLGGAFWWSAHAINRREAARQQVENELRKLSLVVEQSPESVIVTDLEANIEYVNAAFVRNTGYSRAEAIGRNPRFLGSGKTPPARIAALWAALTRGEAWRGEIVNRRKDGSECIDFAIIAPLRQPDGSISHYVGVQEDITEQRRRDEELERHRHHLEELVDLRTRELSEARNRAEAATRAKSTFLANMSHEIRTPLNAVLGFARIGMRENGGRKTGETCARILDAGQHLLGVINDILDFSKIESGKLTVERLPFQPAAAIGNACSYVVHLADAKGLDFRSKTVGTLPAWVMGDPLRLQQILANLLSNAVKFTARGTVRLVVSHDGDAVSFAVADQGIGMTAEQLGRLFQPFEQADVSTTRQFGGSGLGLAISQRLAGLMDGTIGVESTPGAGSTFTLRLPLPATNAPAAAPEKSAPAGRRLDGVRVLAAEDVEANRLILADILDQAGAGLVLVENGQQAVERVTADPGAFDVVLMDVQMPVMDGHEATRRIRQIAPVLPVIGLTAHAFAEERAKCLASGMADHVTKPIDPDELVAAIADHVKHTGGASTPLHAVPPAPTSPTVDDDGAPIDWARFEQRFKGKRDFIRKLVRAILDDHAGTPDALRALSATRDFAGIAFLAHKLVGIAGNLMAADVCELAVAVQATARADDPAALADALRLADRAAAMLAALDAYIGGISEASSWPE